MTGPGASAKTKKWTCLGLARCLESGPMKGYGQFCPVAVAAEIFAERWTPLILRELFAGSRRFSEIRSGMPLISRTLLSQRLRELEDVGVIVSTPLARGRGREYRLTPAGEEFREVVERLGAWGQRHAPQQFAPQNLDPALLMWAMHRRIDVSRLPKPRVVVRFELRGVPARCIQMRVCWLVLERSGADVCVRDPGFEVELVDALIRRVEDFDGQTRAFITPTFELARRQARAAEAEIAAGTRRGPLHGIPFGLKDIYDTRGILTSGHSRVFIDRTPREDATTVSKLYDAGAVLLGKLATHEMAHAGPSFDLPWPPARNPWSLERFTGGSSSRSGAAVAAGMVPVALRSDTGRPA